jgi:hypothetical protein
VSTEKSLAQFIAYGKTPGRPFVGKANYLQFLFREERRIPQTAAPN